VLAAHQRATMGMIKTDQGARPKNNPLSLIDTYVGVQNLTS
jgi:hypothetical protein